LMLSVRLGNVFLTVFLGVRPNPDLLVTLIYFR
jgi:hypothetical protein